MEREYNVGTWLTPSDEYIKDIKQTLVENNYANENTPIGELNPIVQQVIDEVPETWEREADNTVNISFLTTVGSSYDLIFYLTRNKKFLYVSNRDTSYKSYGLYAINCETGEYKQLITKGYRWETFFETSDGKVYVSSGVNSTDTTGLYLLQEMNIQNVSFVDSTKTYGYISFYETSNNIIYCSGSTGVLKLIDDKAYMFNSNLANGKCLEVNNDFFVGNTTNGYYLYKNDTFTLVSNSSGYYKMGNHSFDKTYKDTKENTYFFSSFTMNTSVPSTSPKGFLLYDGIQYKYINDENSTFRVSDIMVDKNGNLYSIPYSPSGLIYKIDGENITSIENSGYTSGKYYYDDNGNLITWCAVSISSNKIYKLENSILSVIFDYSPIGIIKVKGKIYVAGYKNGIYIIENETLTKLVSITYSNGDVLKSNKENIYYFYQIDSTNAITIITLDVSSNTILANKKYENLTKNIKEDKKGNKFFTNSSSPQINDLILMDVDGELVLKYYLGGE